jgi:hypothetical protein
MMTKVTPGTTPKHAENEPCAANAPQGPDQGLTAPVNSRSSFVTLLKKCFSFPAFLGTILLAANFGIERSLRMDPDTWWHLKYGNTILQTGRWPTVDAWSFTAHGMPGMAYEWGGEVLSALAYRLGEFRGLDVLLITLTSVIVLMIYYFAWLRCRNSKAAFFTTFLMLPIAALCFTLRPQLLGYIFLLATLILLERFRQGDQKQLWLLPAIFLLWVNIHGTFFFGFMVLGLYWLSGLTEFSSGGICAVRWKPAERIHLELVGLLSVAVLPLTPYGTRLAAVPLEYMTSLPLNLSDIAEWQPLSTNFWQAKLLLALVFAFILAQVAFRLKYRLEEIALFLVVLYSTFVHFRFAIFFAIVFAPLAASIIARWTPTYDPKIDKHAINAVLMLAALMAMVFYLPSLATLQENISRAYPTQAVRYLQQHPIPGRMFNDYTYGGYMVWALAPRNKVFIDGRGNVYEPVGLFSAYADVVELKPDAFAILRSYRINYCLIPKNSALATLLAASPHWKQAYGDELSAIFVRQPTKESQPTGLNAAVKARLRKPAGT